MECQRSQRLRIQTVQFTCDDVDELVLAIHIVKCAPRRKRCQLTDVISRSGCKDCGRTSHAVTCTRWCLYVPVRTSTNPIYGWRFGVYAPGHLDPYLQHTMLVGMRPSSFMNWTSNYRSQNRTASKNLFSTLLAPTCRGRNERHGSQPSMVRGFHRSSSGFYGSHTFGLDRRQKP